MPSRRTQPLVAASLIFLSANLYAADFSANAGWSSEYIFRGVPQADSSAFAGLDVEHNGFYLGTWAAEVGDSGAGLETDFYGGYAGEWRDFSYSLGVTSYQYTDDFDDDYLEFSVQAGYGLFTLDTFVGKYDNFSGPTLDYRYHTLGADFGGMYASISLWGQDYDGQVFEFGYASTMSVDDTDLFDYKLSIIRNGDIEVLGGTLFESDTSLILSVSKSFNLGANR